MKKLLLLLLCLPFFSVGQSIIYSNNSDKEIIKTDINGNSPTTLYTSPNNNITAVTMDNVNNKVYWSEWHSSSSNFSTLLRSDINSFSPEVVLNVSCQDMSDIHILSDTNLIYWSAQGNTDGNIYNNYNGLENLIIDGYSSIYGMCIDEVNDYIYLNGHVSGSNHMALWRFGLDGSNPTLIGSLSTNANSNMIFDGNNQRIYYHTSSYIRYFDLTTSSNVLVFNLPQNGVNEFTAYDLSSNNPFLVWSYGSSGSISRVRADGSAYQVLVLDANIWGLDIEQSISSSGVSHPIPSPLTSGKNIIYSNNSDKEIIKTDINGNSPTTLYTSPNNNITAVTMDNVNNKVYWSEWHSSSSNFSTLLRSDINSFSPEVVLNVSCQDMSDIHILSDTNLIYWSAQGNTDGNIYNNYNGLENLIIDGYSSIYGMCIDEVNDYIYLNGHVSGSNHMALWRFGLDGSNPTLIGSLSTNANSNMIFDGNNQRIYYHTSSYIRYFDLTTSSNVLVFNLPQNGVNEFTAYDLSSNNPFLVWSYGSSGSISRVRADGSAYQVLVLDANIWGLDIARKTGKLEGFVYIDLDSNGVFDNITEFPLGNQILELEKANGEVSYLTTRADGNYTFEVDTAQYTISYYTDPLWKETSNRTTYNIYVSPDTVITDLNFGIAPEYTKGDLAVYLTNSVTVCSDQTTLWLNVKNLGTETVTGANLELWVDPATTIQSASGSGVISGNYVSWNLPVDFYPFLYTNQESTYSISVQIPGVGAMGSSLIDSARITPLQSNLIELDVTNNSSEVSNIVLCSYDPNDKRVLPIECFNNESDTVEFTVRFQNTGNYPASTVTIVDTLDLEKLDIMSLEILAGSHAYEWSIKEPAVLEVVFNNINLVDSSVSFTESQGFIKYRIQIKDSIADLQPTATPAYIFFDNNPPIITNEPEVRFESNLSVNLQSTNVSCFGENNGTATLNISSGTAPYDINWNIGDTLNSISNLSPGVYSITLKDGQNCSFADSVTITEPALLSSSNTQSACDGQGVTVGNNTYLSSGIYYNLLTSSTGCDSAVTTTVNILALSSSTANVTSCNPVTWNGQTYTGSGIYNWIGSNTNGCDSTATLNLTINTTPIVNNQTVSNCGSYTWNGQTLASSGNYSWVGTNSYGCDSTVNLALTINSSSSSTSNIVSCNNYVWNGQTYNSSGAYSWSGNNANGCDSTATLNLTITNSNTSSSTQNACDSYTWNGQTYTASGVFSYSTTNSSGCDSTSVLNLTVNNSTINTTNQISCGNYTWNINGQAYYNSGTYTEVSTNSNGCAHTEILDLTINSATTNTTTINTCDSYTWPADGNTYNSSGVYSVVSTNSAGCADTSILNLTINNSNTSTAVESACDSYLWSANGQNYNQSGVYNWVTTNSSGCDSTAVLDLTINNSSSYTNTISICYGETVAVGFNNYNLSGVYYDEFTSNNGCDSTVTTNLTVVTQITAFIFQTGVSDIKVNTLGGNTPYSYQWNTGETTQTITPLTNGDYWVIITDLNSCESDTAFFTVNWIATSINEININNLTVYPNPSKDIFNIVFNTNTKQDINLKVHNVLGEVIFNESLKDFNGDYNRSVDLSQYPNAIYILQLNTKDGMINKKLVLEK